MATRGRPRKYKTPNELQAAIDSFFEDCDERGEVPLISWLEQRLGIELYRYEQHDGYAEVTRKAKARSRAVVEQMCFRGVIPPQIAKLYLSANCGYVPKKEVSVESSVDFGEGMAEFLKEFDKRPMDEQVAIAGRMQEIAGK